MINIIKQYKNKIPDKTLENALKEATKRKLNKHQFAALLEKIKEKYDYTKINPGEAVGIVTAESFGEPGTQMSIAENEKIIVKIKDKIRILEIGKFVDKLMEKYGFLSIKDSNILPINDLDIYVPSLNKTEKIEWKKVIECSRHKTNKKLLKLITKSGRSIVATDNHSFVIRKDNNMVPTAGRDLTSGCRIPVIKYFPEHCIEEINLKDYMNIPANSMRFTLIEEKDLLSRKKTLSKPIPKKLKLDKLFGWFIGAYLAEGNATHGQISISNINSSFINNVKSFIDRLGLDYVELYHQRGFSFSRDLKINSALLANFIRTTCKTGSDNKIVPEFCFSAKEDFISGLLRGYFDGDANFHVSRKMIRVSSNSKELIDGIALLLSRFKIFSFKTKDRKNQYWLLIPYKYAPLFLTHIGSGIEHKREALEKLVEQAKKFWNETSQDYTDMISGFGDLFYRTAKKLGYPTRYVNNFTKRQKIGRTALFRYIKKFERLANEKKIDINNELKIMKRMFNSDVVWDAIEEIEYVDNKGKYVYDLSVPGLETFTTAEGIVTHNTLNIFHFAGVAEVSVSLGLPRLIEIFDARKNIKTPAMEIYLKKPYNKDIKKVRKIASSIKETKLEDLASEFSINLTKLQVEISLNKKRMSELGITERSLIKALPISLKTTSIRQAKDKIILKAKAKEDELMETYKLKEKAKEAYIKGVKNISQVLPVKSKNEFIIITFGSNLKEILQLKEIDSERTTTNDIFETTKVLGIEAARQTIINEASKVIEDQGLDIDIRHIMFIADIMTTTGGIRGITRSGITGEKESVLARASFETPIRHIVNASLIGEEDNLNSVIENVLLNQPVPLGTGLPDLIAKMRKGK